MPERYEEEASILDRTEKIGMAFESQDYAAGVQLYTEAISEWARQGQAEAAVQLVEQMAVYRAKLPEELTNRFDVKTGEAFLYAGTSDNEYLKEAEAAYERVADGDLPEIPTDLSTLSEEERRLFSEHFHALDRLGDVAFAGGRFADAAECYAEAIDARGPEDGPFAEFGPRACAMYGEAAAAFALGDVDTCSTKLAAAREKLEDAEGDETTLETSIQNLELAINRLQSIEDSERTTVVEKIQEMLVKNGGANGGVKRTNFNEIAELADIEVRENS